MSLAIPHDKIDFNLIRFVCINNTSSHHNEKYYQAHTFKRNTRNHIPNRTMRNTNNTYSRQSQTNICSPSNKKHYQYQCTSSSSHPTIKHEKSKENIFNVTSSSTVPVSVSNDSWKDAPAQGNRELTHVEGSLRNLHTIENMKQSSTIITLEQEHEFTENKNADDTNVVVVANDSCYEHPIHHTNQHGSVMYFKILYNTSFTSMTGLSVLFLYNELVLSDMQNLICQIETYIIAKYMKFYENINKLNKINVHNPTHKTIIHQIFAFLSNPVQHQKDHFVLKINGLHHNVSTNIVSFTFSIQ